MPSTNTINENEISAHIADLGRGNATVRQRARLNLINIGQAAIPALVKALENSNVQTRQEAIKILEELHDPKTAYPLANMLLDNDTGIRWAAMESLIKLGRASLRPVLELYIHEFDSPSLREGLHHILHVFKDRGMLSGQEIILYEKLHKAELSGFQTSWTSDIAWAAEKALETLLFRNE